MLTDAWEFSSSLYGPCRDILLYFVKKINHKPRHYNWFPQRFSLTKRIIKAQITINNAYITETYGILNHPGYLSTPNFVLVCSCFIRKPSWANLTSFYQLKYTSSLQGMLRFNYVFPNLKQKIWNTLFCTEPPLTGSCKSCQIQD